MEMLAQRIRQLEYHLCTVAPVGTKRCVAESVSAATAKGDHSNIRQNHIAGFQQYQSAPRWNRRFKKHGKQAIGKSRGGWNTKLHLVAASDRNAVTFSLSSGQAGDGPQGRKLLGTLGKTSREVYLLMDRAYEGNATRKLAMELGYIPVVPPKSNRKEPWDYDTILYRQRNQVERLFRRIKRFRRVFTRYDKLDIMFLNFIFFALIVDALL